MDIFDETKQPLKGVWDDELQRQQSKIILVTAIGAVTELTVKQAQDICDELDRVLLSDEANTSNSTKKAL